MKKIVYSLLALCVLVSGCEKLTEKPSLNQGLIGEWEFVKAVGGFTGTHVILPPANSKTTLIFGDYHQYKKNVDGGTVEAENYQLLKVRSIFTGEDDNAIKFIGSSWDDAKLISIQNDSLWLTDNHVEPYGSLYVRVKMP
jgi:hypothetical protein